MKTLNLVKNTKLLTVLLIALLCGALGGCNGSAGEYGGKLIRPVNVYEVDGWGSNPDIYEFTPDGHPHMTCLLLVSGGDSAGGIQCFPKKINKDT